MDSSPAGNGDNDINMHLFLTPSLVLVAAKWACAGFAERVFCFLSTVICVCVSVTGSGARLFLWPSCSLHMGRGDPCSWSELHHDWNILRPVCHGGQ